jgi:hypothetical protein
VLRHVADGEKENQTGKRRKQWSFEPFCSFCSLAFHEQQVVIGAHGQGSVSSASVGVETPTGLFPFLDCFANVIVMPN